MVQCVVMSAATQVRSLAPLAESLIWWHGRRVIGAG